MARGKPVPAVRVTNTIRRWRFERGEMTQQDLAERVGVTRQTIIAIESSKYSPTLELAFKIALALDAPFAEVFGCESGPTKRAT